MKRALLLGAAFELVVGCKTPASAPDDAAAAETVERGPTQDASSAPSAKPAAPGASNVPVTGPFRMATNRATLEGKPFPEVVGARDPDSALRKVIPIKLSKPSPNVALGRGFLLRDRREEDRARWFVVRVDNKSPQAESSVRVVFAQFHDAAGKPVGAGHNVQVHGSACDTEANKDGAHLGLPGVGAFLEDGCLGKGEGGWAIIDLASENECAAKRPCAPGADIGSVELQVWATADLPLLGPVTSLVPTSYEVANDRVSVTLTSRGPNPTVPFSAQGLGLDAAGDPLFFMTFTVDKTARIAPGGTALVSASPTYHGAAATRLAAWTLFIEAPPAP